MRVLSSMLHAPCSMLILCSMLLASCTIQPDPAPPACTLATWHYAAEKIHIDIHTPAPSVTLCHIYCDTVVSRYYGCISRSVMPGDIITITDGVGECEIVVSDNLFQ